MKTYQEYIGAIIIALAISVSPVDAQAEEFTQQFVETESKKFALCAEFYRKGIQSLAATATPAKLTHLKKTRSNLVDYRNDLFTLAELNTYQKAEILQKAKIIFRAEGAFDANSQQWCIKKATKINAIRISKKY